jgi:hypothetical protein
MKPQTKIPLYVTLDTYQKLRKQNLIDFFEVPGIGRCSTLDDHYLVVTQHAPFYEVLPPLDDIITFSENCHAIRPSTKAVAYVAWQQRQVDEYKAKSVLYKLRVWVSDTLLDLNQRVNNAVFYAVNRFALWIHPDL